MYPGDLINNGGGATYFKPQGALINKPLMSLGGFAIILF